MKTLENHSDPLAPLPKASSNGHSATDAADDMSQESHTADQATAPPKKRRKAKAGCAKSPGFYMAPDFDAPLEEFKDYM